MSNCRLCIILLISVLASIPGIARNFPMLHFTVENGLPSNNVYNVMRDHDNFLWFCTDKGLVRYDGISFEKFTTNDGLPDNDVFFTKEDLEGRLWISCYNAELCYYKDGVFHTAKNTPFLRLPYKPLFLFTIEVEKDSSLTFVFKDHTHIVNILHDKMSCFLLKGDNRSVLDVDDAADIRKISSNRYTVITETRSYIVDTLSNAIKKIDHKNREPYKIVFSPRERYFYRDNGLYSMDTSETLIFRFTNKVLPRSSLYVAYTEKTTHFLGTNHGLFINNDIQLLKGNIISGMCQDAEGNYWMTSLDNGVFCISKNFTDVEQYDSVYSGKISYAFASNNYLYYTAGIRDLYRVDHGKPRLLFGYERAFRKKFFSDEEWMHLVNFRYDFGRAIDRHNNYYCIIDPIPFVLEKINTNHPRLHLYKKSDDLDHVKELIIKNDHLIIRSTNAVAEFDVRHPLLNGRMNLHPRSLQDPLKRIFGVAVDDSNAVWYSTYDVVTKNEGDSNAVQKQFGDITFKCMNIVHRYLVGISNKNQLVVCNNFDKNISLKICAGQDRIWDKLYRLNDSTFIVSTDNQYRLLHLFPSADTPHYLLQVIENMSLPKQAEYICSDDSQCYFFKNGSVVRIPIGSLFVTHQPPAIFFKTLKTRNTSYPVSPGMEIRYKESRNINISFRPFCFGSKDLICEYSISKDGQDYWRIVRNNEIDLFDPGYGTYVVKVRARTLSSDLCAPYVFSFTVLKPFWATWLFIGTAALLLLGILVLSVRSIIVHRTRKRELQHASEIKFLRSEYRALNALMNPHFIFNTLNNVQWLVSNGDNMAANHYLRIFSELVRQNMYNITKELIPLSNEMELVKNYLVLEKLRFKNALNYEILVQDVDLDSIKIPPLLIQPLVENAIKHGLLPALNATNLLQVNIYRSGAELIVDVKDNGVGISGSAKAERSLHRSTGIENIRNRIAKLSLSHGIHITFSVQQIQNEAGAVGGTLARICIEINDE